MWVAKQCLDGAKAGMIAHCIEPSPSSQERIRASFDKTNPTDLQRVRYYQMAGSKVSGMDLTFQSEGTWDDRIGGGAYDTWTMTKREDGDKEKLKNKVIVKSVAIDDIIKDAIKATVDYGEKVTGTKSTDAIDTLYMLKIDTQGHKPAVFSGLKESIQNHKIDIIITEFWPKGMDLMNEGVPIVRRDTQTHARGRVQTLRDGSPSSSQGCRRRRQTNDTARIPGP